MCSEVLAVTLKERLTQQLRRDEGEVLHAYKDHLGFLTIGIGRLIDKRKGGGITSEEAAYLLSNDIDRVEKEVSSRLPFYSTLNEPRKAALLNMAFQMGVTGLLGFQRALASIRDEHYADAEHHLLQSTWALQTPDRARRVARQIAIGEWQ